MSQTILVGESEWNRRKHRRRGERKRCGGERKKQVEEKKTVREKGWLHGRVREDREGGIWMRNEVNESVEICNI